MCALLPDKTQDDDGVNKALQINAASTLLSDSSPLAMRRMRELPHLFVRIPHESTVPKVTSLIRDNIGNTDETTNDIVGTAAAVLTAIMQNCKANLESLVQLVVKELVQIESSTRSADLVGEVCGRFGGDRCLKTRVCRWTYVGVCWQCNDAAPKALCLSLAVWESRAYRTTTGAR